MRTLESLNWLSRFMDETPGDEEVGGKSRHVPKVCWSRVNPAPAPKPKLMLWSNEMAIKLGLDRSNGVILGGGKVVEGMDPYAQRYGGHQFGNWAHQLGDGRAITLGEVQLEEEVLELQLKGAGHTPYSRFADGKAVLRSSIREFLCSEAMFHLNVPTTRALSLVTTGESVLRDILYNGNSKPEQGAVVCRVAPSFLRFGSFQIHTASGDYSTLRILVDHTIKHHYPNHSVDDDVSRIKWFTHIAEKTAEMISHWMRVGFVHGVMNTDNMSIHGLTIDYGPYGWLENYDPDWTPNTTDSTNRRYRFGKQPEIGAWNIARFLEAMVPLMDEPEKLNQVLDAYMAAFDYSQNRMWVAKLGLDDFIASDKSLIKDLNKLLQVVETDMTIFFRLLCSIELPEISNLSHAFYDSSTIPEDEWNDWLQRWWSRIGGSPNRSEMRKSNPKYVLRNWMAQLAIDDAEEGDFTVAEQLYKLLKSPYEEQLEFEDEWFQKRPEWARHRVGCSMLSCSS